MHIKSRHIIHSSYNGRINLKKALLELYTERCLVGSIGHTGILLVRKIKSGENLNYSDLVNARRVIRYHAAELARLTNQGYYNL